MSQAGIGGGERMSACGTASHSRYNKLKPKWGKGPSSPRMMLGENFQVHVQNIGRGITDTFSNHTSRAQGGGTIFFFFFLQSAVFSHSFFNPADGDQIFLIHSWSLQMAKYNFHTPA